MWVLQSLEPSAPARARMAAKLLAARARKDEETKLVSTCSCETVMHKEVLYEAKMWC